MFDRNNDGFIDKDELKTVLQKILPKFKLPDEEIKRMISNVDKNNDGKIDYNGNWSEDPHLSLIRHRLLFSFFTRVYGIHLSPIASNAIDASGMSVKEKNQSIELLGSIRMVKNETRFSQ